MSISKKLHWGFGLFVAVVVVQFLVTLGALRREHSTQQAMQSALDASQAAAAIRSQMTEDRLTLANYLMTGSPTQIDQLNDGMSKLDELAHTAQSKVDSQQLRDALSRAAQGEQSWYSTFAQAVIAKRKDVDAGNTNVSDLQVFYMQKDLDWSSKEKEIKDTLDQALRDSSAQLNLERAADESATTVTWVVLLTFLFFALAASIFAARIIARSITSPLFELMAVSKDISESGDLDQKINIDRDDEIGELAKNFSNMMGYLKEMAAVSEAIAGGDLTVAIEPRSKRDTLMHAFARMTEGLRTMVKSVRDSASQVAGGSNQVADASEESAKVSVQASSAIDEVTSTMHEMSVNVQNMVKNTQTQASSVSETSASIDQMVASIQRVADTSKVLLDISHRSREEVLSGIGTMEKTTDGLNRINGAIQSSGEIIGSLGQRADDIGKIVEVIDDLAEQTNLLALNAAIEAARAGEHGLGFAVVADEVRKLAEKSASSTKEIGDLISSIQKEARKAVENMERSTGIVNEGLELGTDLQTALKKISNVVTEVYKFAQEIGAATAEQSHGSTQIAKATTRLNEITHEINSSVEEQASGAQAVVRAMERMRELIGQTTSGSTELAASAEQMSKMARQLLEVMDRFILETTHNGAGGSTWSRRAEGEQGAMAGARYAAAARS